MNPLVIVSSAVVGLIVGIAVSYILRPTTTSNLTFNSYNCATKALTITTTSAMHLFIDALDDTGGGAVQPDFPGDDAIEVTVNGHVTVGPLTHENGAEKVLICVWALSKVDTWSRDCSGGGSSSSSSGHVVKKASLKKTILP
jgi:hypothetical protein